MKALIWTLRLEGKHRPFLWLVHDGPETAREIERAVATMKAQGHTVIVGLSTRRGPGPALVVDCRTTKDGGCGPVAVGEVVNE